MWLQVLDDKNKQNLFSSSLSSHPVAKSLSASLNNRVMLSYARSLLAEAKSWDTHRRTHTVTCGRLSHALSGVLLDKDAAVVIPWAALPPTRCCGRRGDSRPRDKEAPQSAAGWSGAGGGITPAFRLLCDTPVVQRMFTGSHWIWPYIIQNVLFSP